MTGDVFTVYLFAYFSIHLCVYLSINLCIHSHRSLWQIEALSLQAVSRSRCNHFSTVFSDLAAPPQDLSCDPLPSAGPDLAGGRPGAQPNYGSISVTGVSLGAHKTRSSRP